MTTKLTTTAVAQGSGNVYTGTTTFGDLQRADHSAFLTVEKDDGTLISLNTHQMEIIHIDATREDVVAAQKEFEEAAAEARAWEKANALSAKVLAEEAEKEQIEAEVAE